MWIKVCGITALADAEACIEAGVDAIGFNLWPGSKRYRPPGDLVAISRAVKGRIERFGIFVDPEFNDVRAALAEDLIDVVQFHGHEEEHVCQRFHGRYVKAVQLIDRTSLDEFFRFDCARFLVDAPSSSFGGSGAAIDEGLAREALVKLQLHGAKMILAGGLTPSTVAGIVERVRPWGVDVATGVETEPGVKDERKIGEFVAAARSV